MYCLLDHSVNVQIWLHQLPISNDKVGAAFDLVSLGAELLSQEHQGDARVVNFILQVDKFDCARSKLRLLFAGNCDFEAQVNSSVETTNQVICFIIWAPERLGDVVKLLA